MEDKKIPNRNKKVFESTWSQFTLWFRKKEHPRSILNKNVFFHDLLKIIALILLFLIVYSNVDKLNQIILVFVKVGSLLQLVLLFFILKKGWHLANNLKYAFRGLNHGTKAILAVTIVLLIFMAFQNQEEVVNSVVGSYEQMDFQKFNPINTNLNLSFVNLKGITSQLNSCPQINVPIKETSWGELNIAGQTYDGWSIQGSATCRKGTKEGENLNKYYCGGYDSFLGIGNVNAYVQKTEITPDGAIGKTYKYVIWNTYDENRRFIETRCIGDPDEFDRKQAQAFYDEMLKWR